MLMIVDLMMNSHLLRLLILPRTLEIFWELIIEGQEIETMLILRMWRRMIQLKITIFEKSKDKVVQSSNNSLGQ